MSIRIILADDHAIVREGFRALLEKHADIEVVAEAENGRTAVELAVKLRPDVVVMDIVMPVLNGIEATRQITAKAPGVRVIALSMRADRRYVTEMLKAGASGYLVKSSVFSELERGIRAVAANRTYFCPEVAGFIEDEQAP